MKKYKHGLIAGAVAGFFAGLFAYYYCTHTFEFHWPFNWPITAQEIKAEPVTETRDSVMSETDDEKAVNYLRATQKPKFYVGNFVRVVGDNNNSGHEGEVKSIDFRSDGIAYEIHFKNPLADAHYCMSSFSCFFYEKNLRLVRP
jgi:hypothetical protein